MSQRITNIISDVLSNFDELPNSAYVRLPVAMGLFGVSASTIWRLVKANKLVTYKLTPRTTTFSVRELRVALAAKAGAQ